ncbi:MAG: homoserine kinase [Clostridium sp.]
MVRVKVPATTANMGPGFDALGMALEIYNYIEVIPTEYGVETLVENEVLEVSIEENLIFQALKKTYEKIGQDPKGFRIHVYKCDVPMSRGLGSSATCIVGGILAANHILGNPLSIQQMLEIANEMEGHPDNVAPALLGGMVTSVQENGRVYYSKINVPSEIMCSVMIPNFKVSTSDARGVLPTSYSREDCVYNISRVALFVTALNNNQITDLRHIVKDKIHEPYRGRLIPDIDKVFKASENAGGLCEFISGSGSTLLAFVHRDNTNYIKEVENYLMNLENEWTIQVVAKDNNGAKIVSN